MEVVSRRALRAPETFDAWLDALGRATDALPDGDFPPCPNCGHFDLHLEFVADPRTRIGFCAFWSDFCGHGIRVSRAEVPEGCSFLPTDTPAPILNDYIPAFTEVGPSGPVAASAAAPHNALAARIVRLLRRRGSITAEHVEAELGVSPDAAALELQALLDHGTVARSTAEREARYALAPVDRD